MPYYHMVFTLPAAIADIAYQNKSVLYDLLFKVSADTNRIGTLGVSTDEAARSRKDWQNLTLQSPCDLAALGLIGQKWLPEQRRGEIVKEEQQLRPESGAGPTGMIER